MQNSFEFACKYNKRGVYQHPLLLLSETGRGLDQLQRRWEKRNSWKVFFTNKMLLWIDRKYRDKKAGC